MAFQQEGRTRGKRILSNTEGTAGHAGTVAAVTA